MSTIDFYNTNSGALTKRYDNADMSSLHQLLLKYIPQNGSVLDIGFGSGRDLQFLYENNYDVWGIDPSTKFTTNAKQKFPNLEEQFIEAGVPFNKEIIGLNKEFDTVIAIAMWMHLKYDVYADVVESIVSVLNDSSTIIISYSEGDRVNDERYFAQVDLKYITELFKKQGFFLVKTVTTGDSLNRDSLTWVTVVYKKDILELNNG